jgi:hypothetical protein
MEVDAMNETISGAQPVLLDLEDKDGMPYHGRIAGTLLGESGDLSFYVTKSRKFLVYDAGKGRYWVVANLETDLRGMLHDDAYADAMDALGIIPTIDLNV